jgi:hypothetical protein
VLIGALMFLPALISSRDQGSADASKIVIVDATGAGLGERVAARLSGGISGGGGATPRVETVLADGVAQAESLATKDVMAEAMKGYLVSIRRRWPARRRAMPAATRRPCSTCRNSSACNAKSSLRMEKPASIPTWAGSDGINVNVSTERLTKQDAAARDS